MIQSYQTLAAARADAFVDGKDRTFFLNLATYRSSDEYLAIQLRNRAWNRIDYVSDRAFQWAWQSEEDFLQFRELRDDAESLKLRRSVLIAILVANRLLAGISSIQAANRVNHAKPELSISLAPPPPAGYLPVLRLGLRI